MFTLWKKLAPQNVSILTCLGKQRKQIIGSERPMVLVMCSKLIHNLASFFTKTATCLLSSCPDA